MARPRAHPPAPSERLASDIPAIYHAHAGAALGFAATLLKNSGAKPVRAEAIVKRVFVEFWAEGSHGSGGRLRDGLAAGDVVIRRWIIARTHTLCRGERGAAMTASAAAPDGSRNATRLQSRALAKRIAATMAEDLS